MKRIIYPLLAAFVLTTASVARAGSSVDTAALREVLSQQEILLAAAERDLAQAQVQLQEAQSKKTPVRRFALVFTGIGLAGMALAGASLYKILPVEVAGAAFSGAALITGISATTYFVETHDLQRYENAVSIRLELVRASRRRVAQLKSQLDN